MLRSRASRVAPVQNTPPPVPPDNFPLRGYPWQAHAGVPHASQHCYGWGTGSVSRRLHPVPCSVRTPVPRGLTIDQMRRQARAI
jgi:hypothetical protein